MIFLNKLNLESYQITTQVEPYDHKVEFIQAVKRINLVVMALDEDIWRYLTLKEVKRTYPKLKLKRPIKDAWDYALNIWENN